MAPCRANSRSELGGRTVLDFFVYEKTLGSEEGAESGRHLGAADV